MRKTPADYAHEAAAAAGAKVWFPAFGPHRRPDQTDIADVLRDLGPEVVKNAPREAQEPKPLSLPQPEAENAPTAILASPSLEWPAPLAPEAFQGLAGEIVRVIEPHTESDPAAILLQTLVCFGALVGKGPHVRVEGDEHHARLFALLVGRSSKARKGTSWGRTKELFLPAGLPRVVEGLSTGEGLKWAVRDAIKKQEREKNGFLVDVEVDPGVADKRLIAVEAEFAQVLRQCARPGNTLSATIRAAWDSGNLQSLTKNDPVCATGSHICIIGHITLDELRAELTATDSANGFANRFLFMAVERSKKLPFGGDTLDVEVRQQLCDRIRQAVDIAKSRAAMQFTPAAREMWSSVYNVLSEGPDGLLGAVTARAEAQTLRLSLLYALMDSAPAIDVPHLVAALAIWERAEASARYIFGSALGDRIADTILRALRTSPEGMTRTAISKLFSGNEKAERIGAGLELLEKKGLALRHKAEASDGGRPSETWRARA
jgi:hypothetical protein